MSLVKHSQRVSVDSRPISILEPAGLVKLKCNDIFRVVQLGGCVLMSAGVGTAVGCAWNAFLPGRHCHRFWSWYPASLLRSSVSGSISYGRMCDQSTARRFVDHGAVQLANTLSNVLSCCQHIYIRLQVLSTCVKR